MCMRVQDSLGSFILLGLLFLWTLAELLYQQTFEWVDKFDLRDAPKRRVQCAMEKENRNI